MTQFVYLTDVNLQLPIVFFWRIFFESKGVKRKFITKSCNSDFCKLSKQKYLLSKNFYYYKTFKEKVQIRGVGKRGINLPVTPPLHHVLSLFCFLPTLWCYNDTFTVTCFAPYCSIHGVRGDEMTIIQPLRNKTKEIRKESVMIWQKKSSCNANTKTEDFVKRTRN